MASHIKSPLLFLDLGSCASDSGLEMAVRSWTAENPNSVVVFFVPLLDREAETRLIFRLAVIGAGRVMTESDFARPQVWHNLKEAHTLATLEEEIRAEFLEAVASTGRRLRAEPIVLQLLSDAPEVTDLNDAVAAALRNY